MQINLRNIFARMAPTQQDIQTLHGVIMAIAEGRKGPARGGVLDGAEAEMLRALLAEHGGGRVPKERGPVRGLARLLRRNPTDAERALWQALVNDRRFAGRGFKRQTPVGQHICDFVSFPLRLVIDLVPAEESEAAAAARAQRRAWLAERDYGIVEVKACRRRDRSCAQCWIGWKLQSIRAKLSFSSAFSAAAAPARSMARSLITARNFTPRLASAAARSAEWQ